MCTTIMYHGKLSLFKQIIPTPEKLKRIWFYRGYDALGHLFINYSTNFAKKYVGHFWDKEHSSENIKEVFEKAVYNIYERKHKGDPEVLIALYARAIPETEPIDTHLPLILEIQPLDLRDYIFLHHGIVYEFDNVKVTDEIIDTQLVAFYIDSMSEKLEVSEIARHLKEKTKGMSLYILYHKMLKKIIVVEAGLKAFTYQFKDGMLVSNFALFV